MTRLIYCAAGNRRFAQIAIERGYGYGAQLPNTVYFDPEFTDQNWKKPVRDKYMQRVKQYRPRLATVLDLEYEHQLEEVMSWADEAAQYVTEAVIIIPKVIGITRKLPRSINGKQVRLGYSASSTFSSTPVGLDEFKGWPMHCLGGSVRTQLNLTRTHDLQSADGNYIQNLARKWSQFYSPGRGHKNKNWPTLREAGINVETDAIYLAFELTCISVPMVFKGAKGHDVYEAQLAYLDSIGIKPQMKQLALEGL